MPVVRVASSFCDSFTGGLTEFEVSATNVRGMFRELGARFPGMAEFLEARAAVAIDGTIYRHASMQPIGPDSDIVLIPRVGGG
jgi:hypothetical protein